MIYIILFLIIVSLCVLLYLQQIAFSKQQKEMITALIAKSSKEYVEIKREEQPKEPEKPIFPDLPLDEVPDDKFEDVIFKDLEEKDE
jgi:hypothetical protein